MTTKEIIHVYENSRLVTEFFTEEAVTAAYVEGLAALRTLQEWEGKKTVYMCSRCGYSCTTLIYTAGKCPVCGHIMQPEPLTNAGRIRAMSDRELAKFLAAKFSDLQSQQVFGEISLPTATQLSAMAHTWYCAWMQWLQQPAEEDK